MDPRMGAFDAVMYDVEEDPTLRSFIVVLVETESPPDLARLRFRMDRLTRLLPKLRQRVVGNPMSLVPPRWETVENFDLDYHIRQVVLPEGNMTDLLAHTASWSSQDFDRARPLWELAYFIGLQGDRGAIALKLHHAITDGVGGMQLAAALLDLTPDADDPTDLPDAPDPDEAGWRDRLSQGTDFQLKSIADGAVGAAKALLGTGQQVVADPGGSLLAAQELVSSASRVLAPASTPLSPLWTKRSLGTRLVELSLDLSDLKAAAKAAGGTLNDAFVAGVIGALRSYHEEFGDLPDELRIHMPVNLRTADEAAQGGNHWIPARFPVPLNEAGAGLRIRQLHPLLAQARNEPALGISDPVYKVLMTLPRAITTRIAGGLMKGTDFVATNVPGPPIPVYIVGSRVTRMIPFAPRGGAAINVGLMSYNGRAEIGINIDTEAVEHPDALLDCFRESFAQIVATVGD